MRKNVLIAALAFGLLAGVASAHKQTLHYTKFVTLSIAAQEGGKTVTGVQARLGILAMKPFGPGGSHWHFGSEPYWACEQSIKLEKKGSHFFGKSRLSATELPGGHQMGPVMVQYTVYFADGTSMKLKEKTVKVERSHNCPDVNAFNEALAKETKAFNETKDALETFSVSLCWVQYGLPY